MILQEHQVTAPQRASLAVEKTRKFRQHPTPRLALAVDVSAEYTQRLRRPARSPFKPYTSDPVRPRYFRQNVEFGGRHDNCHELFATQNPRATTSCSHKIPTSTQLPEETKIFLARHADCPCLCGGDGSARAPVAAAEASHQRRRSVNRGSSRKRPTILAVKGIRQVRTQPKEDGGWH